MPCSSAISLVVNPPTSSAISQEFRNHDGFLSVLFITVPNLGQVLGAFYIGPLSERFGRLPVLHGFNVLWLVFTLAGGFSNSISQVTVFRFFTGAAISSINLNPAVAGDLFLPNQRGFALSIASLIPLAGSSVGQVLGGYVTQYLNWRWTFCVVAIATGAILPISISALRETYVLVLRRRAIKKQGLSNRDDRARPDIFGNGNWAAPKALSFLITRPFVILRSSWLAEVYGFSEGSSGLVYLSTTAGTLFASLYCGLTLDYFLVQGLPYKKKDTNAAPRSENRLIAVIPALFVFPIGVLLYGWAVEKRVHFIVPILSTFLYGFSLSSATTPIMSYIVDIFGDRAASAVGLGYGWSNTLLALILVTLAPVILWAIFWPPSTVDT
ncbi:MFS general substrate transporter [Poronia punctata]|nr:MFS general substrate transporter [Poronia punctata]